ncbi:MAG TPA: VOC family protein [Casimicrobiaceae bacterium]|nr:VOC family protein [Casimicrobiaceae bacterium]
MSIAAAPATLDHLVVAAATLEQGEDHLEALTGARPQRGGRHVAMGTHNSLLRLGESSYIEVIAIDPEAPPPSRPRWFALDTPAMRAAIAEAPRLIHWVARCEDIDAAVRASSIDPGRVHPMERGPFRWRITIPDDGHLPGGGLVPTLIQWADTHHPVDTMPDRDLQLAALAGAHPEPSAIRAVLAALGLGETLRVTFDAQPRLAALLQGPRGLVTV